jgi:hypothetical protein
MGRFDFVKFDAESIESVAEIKVIFEDLEDEIEDRLPEGRAKSLAMTRLEEAYMWVGKAIRDSQIDRNGVADPNESRGPLCGRPEADLEEPPSIAEEPGDTVADPVSPGETETS